MYWIDADKKEVWYSKTSRGNETHKGEKMPLKFGSDKLAPVSITTDWITGNIYLGLTDPALISDYFLQSKATTSV